MRAGIPKLRNRQVVTAERCKQNDPFGYQTQALSTALQALPIATGPAELACLTGHLLISEHNLFREKSLRMRSNAAKPIKAKKTVVRFGSGPSSLPLWPYHGNEGCALFLVLGRSCSGSIEVLIPIPRSAIFVSKSRTSSVTRSRLTRYRSAIFRTICDSGSPALANAQISAAVGFNFRRRSCSTSSMTPPSRAVTTP